MELQAFLSRLGLEESLGMFPAGLQVAFGKSAVLQVSLFTELLVALK